MEKSCKHVQEICNFLLKQKAVRHESWGGKKSDFVSPQVKIFQRFPTMIKIKSCSKTHKGHSWIASLYLPRLISSCVKYPSSIPNTNSFPNASGYRRLPYIFQECPSLFLPMSSSAQVSCLLKTTGLQSTLALCCNWRHNEIWHSLFP